MTTLRTGARRHSRVPIATLNALASLISLVVLVACDEAPPALVAVVRELVTHCQDRDHRGILDLDEGRATTACEGNEQFAQESRLLLPLLTLAPQKIGKAFSSATEESLTTRQLPAAGSSGSTCTAPPCSTSRARAPCASRFVTASTDATHS